MTHTLRRRVVITGLGAVTPLGSSWDQTWAGLLEGRSGIKRWPFFDAHTFPASICGVVEDGDTRPDGVSASEGARLGRPARMGVRAAQEAISQAGLERAVDDPRRGVYMGHSVARPALTDLEEQAMTGHIARVAPAEALAQEPNVALNVMARLLGSIGPMVGVATACAASAHAIGEAVRAIEDGDVDMALAGGFDSLTSWIDLLGFGLLGALTQSGAEDPESASRPFDATRDGFVIGEGAAVVVLESEETAAARGATVLARLDGYGASLNAYRITDSPPDGSGALECMRSALTDAGWRAESVDLIVAHGTSTPGNDRAETKAIRRLFGDHADSLVVAAPKSSLGHLTAASAAAGLLVAVQSLVDGTVPGTRNLEHPDPDCDLDYLAEGTRTITGQRALVDAFAFGGTNACLAVSGVAR